MQKILQCFVQKKNNLLIYLFVYLTLLYFPAGAQTLQVENVFRIQNGTMSTFTPYTTSEFKNCEQYNDVDAENGSFIFTLEPSSITTFVSN